VVDADLSGYFDTIPHAGPMRLVKGRVSDGSILKLIKGWLRAPIVEEDPETGVKRTVKNRCGTPQGGLISPLLANLYLDGLDKAVNGVKGEMAGAFHSVSPARKAAANCGRRSGRKPPGAPCGRNPKKSSLALMCG
jgi:retron-type reverse transcriptase